MFFALENDADLQEQYDCKRFTSEFEEKNFNCWSNFIEVPNFEQNVMGIKNFQAFRMREYEDFIGRHYYGAD